MIARMEDNAMQVSQLDVLCLEMCIRDRDMVVETNPELNVK